jgi:O-antigen ligase/tetratricopeptide (TPR) repeat protein
MPFFTNWMNTTLRNTIFLGIFLVPFIPFIVSGSLLFPFITGKNFAFRIIVEIIFALWVVLMLRDKEYRPKFSWLLVAITVFTVLIGIADMFAQNPSKAFWSNFERMEGFLSIFHLFLYFIVVSSVLHLQKYWNRFWYTWVGSSLMMCIYGTFQLAGKTAINQGGVRVDGTLGNATYLAVFLMFNIFLGLFLFLRTQDKKTYAWIFGPVIIYQLVILYHTATRGDILGLLGGLFVTVLLTALFEKKQKIIRNIAIGGIVALVLMVGGFIAIRNTKFVQSSPVLQRFASLSIKDIQTQGRYYIWPMAIQGFKERPILGWGQEGFSYIFNEHYNPKMYEQEQWFDRAHSTPLDWLISGGILGLLSFLSIIFFAFWYIWKSKNQDLTFTEKSLITGLLAAYVFQAIFVFDNLVSYLLLFSVLGMIHAMNGGNHIKLPEAIHSKTGLSVISIVVIILFIPSLYFFNIKPILASQTLIDAMQNLSQPALSLDLFKKAVAYDTFANPEIREQLVNSAGAFMAQSVPNDIKSGYVQFVKDQYTKQLLETPKDARYYLFYGNFLQGIGDSDGALEQFTKGLEYSPSKQTILLEIGTVLIQKKEYVKALGYLKTAYESEPDFLDARIYYAIGALVNNNISLANELFAGVPTQTLLFDDRIVQALIATNRYQELAEIFTRRIAEGQDTVQNNVSLAVSYVRMGNNSKAVEILRRYEAKDPSIKAQFDGYIKEILSGKSL